MGKFKCPCLELTDDEMESPKGFERSVSFDGESLRRSFRRSLRKQSAYKEQMSVVSHTSTVISEQEEVGVHAIHKSH